MREIIVWLEGSFCQSRFKKQKEKNRGGAVIIILQSRSPREKDPAAGSLSNGQLIQV